MSSWEQRNFVEGVTKDGALAAFRELEAAGLGKLKTTGSTRGASTVCVIPFDIRHTCGIHECIIDLQQVYSFEKATVPADGPQLEKFLSTLTGFGVSLTSYKAMLDGDSEHE